jgi:hydroxymethylpyrimidine pyrophosphatase-like HAD family hydrolase
MRFLDVDGGGAAVDRGVRAQLARTKVLYTDLDGTLLGNRGRLLVDGDNQPSARTAQAIVRVNSTAGLTVVPTTGRSVTQLMEISRLCGWWDFIAETGAIRSYWDTDARDRINYYDTPTWSAETLSDGRTPLDIIEASGALEVLQAAFPGQIELHAPWTVNREATDVLRGRVDMTRAATLLADITPTITLVENGVIHPMQNTLAPSDEPIRAYHLTPSGVSKRTAIEADLARRGLTGADAVMIGDGLADVQTAPAVALVFMVNNALGDRGLDDTIEATPNAVVTRGARGDGWAELAGAWLAARNTEGDLRK